MKMNGSDCSILIKTQHHELNVPYSDETIREAVSVLQEEASIEGNGQCKAIRKKCGVTGCVVSPLTITTAPLMLYLAFGSVSKPFFVSETRDLHRYELELLPMENSDYFHLIQDRGIERKLFELCKIQSFELRFEKEQAIKIKLDITGKRAARFDYYDDIAEKQCGERFKSNNVVYRINNLEYKNIYGLTITVKKDGGTKTEVWIKRALNNDFEIPENIENLVITANLFRDKYECRYFGSFRITLKNLVLVSDEASVNSADTVIGPLRYYVSGSVFTQVFTAGGETL